MNKKLKPDYYYQDIFSVNYKLLKKNNIKYLLIDLDNTIATVDAKSVDDNIIKLFTKIKKDFKIILFSNALPSRVKSFSKILDIDYNYFSLKPLNIMYNKIINKYNINPSNIAGIGDQLYTDILGANKMNITSILVDPLSSKESILTRINRLKENIAIKKYKIIERGKYND